jgi:hypothetical protein
MILVTTTLFLVASAACAAGVAGDRGVVFVFQHRASPGKSGQFVARTSDAGVITQARKELAKPEAERTLHPNGRLAAGADGNAPWSWHIEDNGWKLVEMSMGSCDGAPDMVENNLEYWLGTVTRFCPWQAFVLKEQKE